MATNKIESKSPDEWKLQPSSPNPRYVVRKDSGSYWARLEDTKTGATVCRSNVLKKDAWANLDKHCDRLNERDKLDQALKAV